MKTLNQLSNLPNGYKSLIATTGILFLCIVAELIKKL